MSSPLDWTRHKADQAELLPPGWNVSPSQGYPPAFVPVSIYTPG